MTLADFFAYLHGNPLWVIIYFVALPFIAFLIGISTKEKGMESPWKFLYSGIIYLVSVPGVFAITLIAYQFFFERQSIMNMNLITQVLPIAAMFFTFFIIKKFVNLNYIPGFGKLGNLVSIIACVIFFLWILEKMRIVVFSYMPMHYLLIIIIGLLVLIRFSWWRLSRN